MQKIPDTKFEPAGYNVLINIGEAADQKVMRCHVHITLRYSDETDNPRGGIQGFVFEETERVVERYY